MRAGLVVLLSLALAGSALAQEQPAEDPIGDVISGAAATETMDEEQAEAVPADPSFDAPVPTQPPAGDEEAPDLPAAATGAGVLSPSLLTAPPPTINPAAPYIRPPPPSSLPKLDRPVMIDELDRSPEGPKTPTEQAYESRVKSGVLSAQGQQGPLDGPWVVRAGGADLYAFLLVDKGSGVGPPEGAWRSLRSDRPAGQVGLIEIIDRTPTGLYVRFKPKGMRESIVLTLTAVTPGSYSGELWEDGEVRQVTMRRQVGP